MGKHAGVAVVAILMGLNLLEVLPFRLPSLDVDVRTLQVPPILQVRRQLIYLYIHVLYNSVTTVPCVIRLSMCTSVVSLGRRRLHKPSLSVLLRFLHTITANVLLVLVIHPEV